MATDSRDLPSRSDELLDDFEAWAGKSQVEMGSFVVEVALEWRTDAAGNLDEWTTQDVRELLLDWFPRNITIPEPEWPAVLLTLHRWVDFLVDLRSHRPGDAAALHAEIDRATDEFHARMSDERNYGLDKFWTARMLEAGVDPEDGEQVEAFMTAVNAGEIEYDQETLDLIMRFDGLDGPFGDFGAEQETPRLPPVVLPSDAELAALAQQSMVVSRLRVLVTWVGLGRTLTQAKKLRIEDARELAELLAVDQPYVEQALSSADLPEVSLVVAWAVAIRVVRVLKGRLVPVKSAAGLPDRPLELWRRAFHAFGELGAAVCPPVSHSDEPPLVGLKLTDVTQALWLALYSAGDTPLPAVLLVDLVRDIVADANPFAGFVAASLSGSTWERDLDRVLAALQVLGALDLTVTDDPAEREKIVELSGKADPELTLVRLTPLGRWGVRELLVEDGVDAPLAEDFAGASVEELSAVLNSGPSLEVGDAVLGAWLGARTPEKAAAELAEFCADATTPGDRLMALAGLSDTGPAGVEQVRRLRTSGGIVGALATEWLVNHDALDANAATEQETTLSLGENLMAMHENNGLVEGLMQFPSSNQIDFVRALATNVHPDSVELLKVIGAESEDESVAEAARAALEGAN
ncbi:hypothetical protein [Fodinicola feengrottensis]|uniref:hypothetical protein n=1 Tax=Fodinicola feengrottensis TaxID=435914 RepID=UPI0031D9497A